METYEDFIKQLKGISEPNPEFIWNYQQEKIDTLEELLDASQKTLARVIEENKKIEQFDEDLIRATKIIYNLILGRNDKEMFDEAEGYGDKFCLEMAARYNNEFKDR